jgi:hypothetical protein
MTAFAESFEYGDYREDSSCFPQTLDELNTMNSTIQSAQPNNPSVTTPIFSPTKLSSLPSNRIEQVEKEIRRNGTFAKSTCWVFISNFYLIAREQITSFQFSPLLFGLKMLLLSVLIFIVLFVWLAFLQFNEFCT